MDKNAKPTTSARLEAWIILRRNPQCLRNGVPLNDLLDDIAAAIDKATLKRDNCGGG